MQIDNEQVLSHKKVTVVDLMLDIDKILEGKQGENLLLAYCIDPSGEISNDIVILQCDPYGENDDEYLEFEGARYNWERELRDVSSVRKNYEATFERTDTEGLVKALKYYLEFDAYYDGQGRVGGKWTWGGNKEKFAKARRQNEVKLS